MTFLQNLRFGLTLGAGFALGEKLISAIIPWLGRLLKWALFGLVLAAVLNTASWAGEFRRTLSRGDCRVMEDLLRRKGSNVRVETGRIRTVKNEVVAELDCRTENGAVAFTLVVPLGNLNRRPALEPGFLD
jgi:hypothetical protein